MIKKIVDVFLKNKIWFITIMCLNLMMGIFLYLIDSKSFVYIFPTFILGSILIYGLICLVVYRSDKRKIESLQSFIENPDLNEEESCLDLFSNEEKKIIHLLGEKLRTNESLIKSHDLNLKEYEEYIELWAHEIKTPLALMTFVLDNRKDEISVPIYRKLEYSRTKMQEDIERMLYYARVKSDHLDYIFKKISLSEICSDVIEEYKNLIYEQKIMIINEVQDIDVVSDYKGLLFILRQIFSNSIKYMNKEEVKSFISISRSVDNENIILTIRDNGIGVNIYDLPFLFDKGFTGDTGDLRKQSTGMGLYLAAQVASNLKINIKVSEDYKGGFEISLLFPIVK